MERKHWTPVIRAGLGALVAALVLLAGTGTCVASGAADTGQRANLAQGPTLDLGAGYGADRQAAHVEALQRSLQRLGWAPGRADGLFGPRTEAALIRFQRASGVTVDGIAGPETRSALARALNRPLSRGAGFATPKGSQRVRTLQRKLQRRGLRPGPVDGRYGPRTEAAVIRLQRAVGLKASGTVNTITRRVLRRQPDQQSRPETPAGSDSAPVQPDRGISATPLAVDTASDDGIEIAGVIGISALALLLGGALGLLFARARTAQGPLKPVAATAGTGPQLPLMAVEPARSEQRTVTTTATPMKPLRAVGYVSIPKVHDPASELDDQAEAVERLCRRRGWELLHVVRDVENGHPKGLERPGLQYALERIAEGEASCLIVSELSRLSRSAADLGQIVEWLVERDCRLVAIDVRLDTGSSSGQLTARTLMSVGEWEGRRIGEQTRKGLAAARARRAKAGRPAVEDIPDLKERISAMRAEGMTLQSIADRLNEEGVPTLRGGSQWRPSSVQAAAGYRRPKKGRTALKDEASGGPA